MDYFEPGCRWLSGPEFLWQNKDTWSTESTETKQDEEPESAGTVTATTTIHEKESPIYCLLRRYSSWQCLLRVMCWLLRFSSAVKKDEQRSSGPLKLSEMRKACKVVIQQVLQGRVSSSPGSTRSKEGKQAVKPQPDPSRWSYTSFTFTGVDFFGPFYTKRGRATTVRFMWKTPARCLLTPSFKPSGGLTQYEDVPRKCCQTMGPTSPELRKNSRLQLESLMKSSSERNYTQEAPNGKAVPCIYRE
ncbi:hypothetical protein AC249_AIPGENE24492 [Exaiptasia diaphana]|nr:hypothetical protein AC249_AIPGENE24492 [Exaiptasia diaphana]